MTTDGTEGDGPPAELFAFFEGMPRQGPGSDTLTRALWRRLRPLLPAAPQAADMGSGSGATALVLAAEGAQVTAVDVHAPFLDACARAAGARGLAHRVTTRCASMTDSGLAPGSLDLIWCEGAAYIPGLGPALAAFADLLRPGGLAVVSEVVWTDREAASPEARAYWDQGYPGMGPPSTALATAEDNGFALVAAETLDPPDWEQSFLAPMATAIAAVPTDAPPALAEVVAEQARELALFREHGEGFTYLYLALRRR